MRAFLGDIFVGVGGLAKGDEQWRGAGSTKNHEHTPMVVTARRRNKLWHSQITILLGAYVQQSAGALRATAGRYSKLVGV